MYNRSEYIYQDMAQSAGAVEYTDCLSVKE